MTVRENRVKSLLSIAGSQCLHAFSVASAVSNSLRPDGLQPVRFLCLWDPLGKNTGVGFHSLLQGIFPTQGLNQDLPHCGQILYHLSPGKPKDIGVGYDLLKRIFYIVFL